MILNNMAVSMLQRSCHRQGFETLQDAIKIAKSLMRNEEEKQQPGHLHQLLTKALHRASNPLITPSCVQLDAVSHNDADFCGLRDILAPSSNNNKTSPMMLIRIDTSDKDILQDDGQMKQVRFDSVSIRLYEQVAGDNPSCSSGAPISIGWRYKQKDATSVDHLEQVREQPMRVLRSRKDLILTRQERVELLLDWGVSLVQVGDATVAADRIRRQRRENSTTNRQLEELSFVDRTMTPTTIRTCRLSTTTGMDATKQKSLGDTKPHCPIRRRSLEIQCKLAEKTLQDQSPTRPSRRSSMELTEKSLECVTEPPLTVEPSRKNQHVVATCA
jgi:hypothetical protein